MVTRVLITATALELGRRDGSWAARVADGKLQRPFAEVEVSAWSAAGVEG